MPPLWSTTTMASGAASSSPRYFAADSLPCSSSEGRALPGTRSWRTDVRALTVSPRGTSGTRWLGKTWRSKLVRHEAVLRRPCTRRWDRQLAPRGRWPRTVVRRYLCAARYTNTCLETRTKYPHLGKGGVRRCRAPGAPGRDRDDPMGEVHGTDGAHAWISMAKAQGDALTRSVALAIEGIGPPVPLVIRAASSVRLGPTSES